MTVDEARQWLAGLEDLAAFASDSVQDEEKLRVLCQSPSSPAKRCRWMPYWTAEGYGFGAVLRQYTGYPAFLPLCVETDHGAQLFYQPLKSELESDAPFMLFHNRIAAQRWRAVSKKPALVMSSPFALYRRLNAIEKPTNTRGTLVFPSHSTVAVSERSSWDLYVRELQHLPDNFKPIAACIYYVDILKERHHAFLNAGIPVLTAGNPFDPHFTERFYRILSRFSFSTSNDIGSYSLYSIEMGIPFSLYGPRPNYWNERDINLPLGESPTTYEVLNNLSEIFVGLHTEISIEQQEFVRSLLGLDHLPSTHRLKRVLYRALFKWTLKRTASKLSRLIDKSRNDHEN